MTLNSPVVTESVIESVIESGTTESGTITQTVVGFPVTALAFDVQMELMLRWASNRLSKVICVANVHMLMEGRKNPAMSSVLGNADLVTPDGMPLVWLISLMRGVSQDRVAGMDILLALCQQSPSHHTSLFFLGSEPKILQQMEKRLNLEFPDLHIAGMLPLPFRPLTREENDAVVETINSSGAGIVLVSLGCPKQELWMAQHKDKIHAVMIGLGGVFPVYAGIHRWAPAWIRQMGLEWLFRLVQEPRRLWRRYSQTIPAFLYLAVQQVLISWLVSLLNNSIEQNTKGSQL
jgi:N-acetylglucosaminyldiphosphoundecaprenol N-acetyl-beta-D-mannosaminyltransferase